MTTLQVSAQKQLRQYIEQVERLEAEKKGLADDIRDKFTEMKGVGFDVKIVKKVLARRKKGEDAVKEEDALLAAYCHALQMDMFAEEKEEEHA